MTSSSVYSRMTEPGLQNFSWDAVETVLLDMDGTLLDKYFDDYFWERLLPEEYARRYRLDITEARPKLLSRYKQEEGRLTWTDLDYWSKELDIDIPALKEQIHHLIAVHPHVEEFLQFLQKRDKRIHLVTNAHWHTHVDQDADADCHTDEHANEHTDFDADQHAHTDPDAD